MSSANIKLDKETAADKAYLIKKAPHGTVTKICTAAIRREAARRRKKEAKK